MTKLTYTRLGGTGFQIIYNVSFNNITVGELILGDDGSYAYFPINFNGSCISSWVLKDIANKLDELNSGWEELIDKMLKDENYGK